MVVSRVEDDHTSREFQGLGHRAQLLQQRLRGLLEEGILGVAADLHQGGDTGLSAGHAKYADVSIVTGVLPDANTVIVPPVPTFTIAEFEIDPPGV